MQSQTGTSWIHRGDSVRVDETPVGKGVFAERPYPRNAVIGEITGEIVRGCPHGSEYSFEIANDEQLEPYPPFRFLNHRCEPNCEFDWVEDDSLASDPPSLYVIALRNIQAGEELTIDYNWPASFAIPCQCDAETCRGWIVSADELNLVNAD